MDADYITLDQAAHLAGYSNPSNLHTAARAGKLKTVKFGPHARLTTQAWLDEYLTALRTGNYRRGVPKGQDAGEAAE